MDKYCGDDGEEPGGHRSGDTADEVDLRFRELTGSLMVPGSNECLVCFLLRAEEFLRPQGFAMVDRFRNANASRATRLEYRLMNLGAYSDSMVLQRAAVVNIDVGIPERCPDCGLPCGTRDCLEVRHGSTQPCKLWRWKEDAMRERIRRIMEGGGFG